jgi:hypothetical protein
MQQFRADQHGKKNSLPPRNDPADPDRNIDNWRTRARHRQFADKDPIKICLKMTSIQKRVLSRRGKEKPSGPTATTKQAAVSPIGANAITIEHLRFRSGVRTICKVFSPIFFIARDAPGPEVRPVRVCYFQERKLSV